MQGVLWDSGPVDLNRLEAQQPSVMAGLVTEAMRLAPGFGEAIRCHHVPGRDWQERAAQARQLASFYGDDVVFVTMRWNAEWTPDARGLAIYYRPDCDRSAALARGLLAHLRGALAPELPVYWAGLWADACPLLLSVPRPALRICPGFVTNPEDQALLQDGAFRRRVAEAIAVGLARNLGVRFIFHPGGDGWLERDLTLPSEATLAELGGVLQNTVLEGLHEAFLAAEAESGVSALYLSAHALREVAIFRDLARIKQNVLAYGCHREKNYEDGVAFVSRADCIRTVAAVLRRDYLSPDGPHYHGPTLKGLGLTYSFDPHWPYEVAAILERIRPLQKGEGFHPLPLGRKPWRARLALRMRRLWSRGEQTE